MKSNPRSFQAKLLTCKYDSEGPITLTVIPIMLASGLERLFKKPRISVVMPPGGWFTLVRRLTFERIDGFQINLFCVTTSKAYLPFILGAPNSTLFGIMGVGTSTPSIVSFMRDHSHHW